MIRPGVIACPLCGGTAIRLPVQSEREHGFGCQPCRGLFLINMDALPLDGQFALRLRDAARSVLLAGDWARIKADDAGNANVYRIEGSGRGHTSAYWEGLIARLMGLGDMHNPNRIGHKAYLEWYDGWASLGRQYA